MRRQRSPRSGVRKLTSGDSTCTPRLAKMAPRDAQKHADPHDRAEITDLGRLALLVLRDRD